LTLLVDDTLLKQAAMARLQSPKSHDLDMLRSWFERPGMGAFPLLGMDRMSWSKDYENDLAAILPREKPDLFSEWFTEKLIPAFHHRIGSKFKVDLPVLYTRKLTVPRIQYPSIWELGFSNIKRPQ
jgi:hypothetical protein